MSKKISCVPDRFLSFLAVVISITICGCGALKQPAARTETTPAASEGSTVPLSLSPASGTIETGQVTPFNSPFGPFPVQWSVNGVIGGNSLVGTVDEKGAYTAPLVPPANSVTLAAGLANASENLGVLSASATINVVNPAPLVSQLSPSAIPLGSVQTQITVTGTGFNPTSKLIVNNQVVPTTFLDMQHLSAVLPELGSATAGTLSAVVSNPTPGGGNSNSQVITLLNPAPEVTQIFPQSVSAGSVDLKVTLTGTGFQASSQVSLNGQRLMSSFSEPSTLSVVAPSSSMVSGGPLSFVVVNDSPGGGSSISPALTVLNPIPVATTLSPGTVFAGTGSMNVTISGSGFIPDSMVSTNGQILTTTFLNSSQLQVSVPNSLITNTDQVPLIISNSAPGGGASFPIEVTVLTNGQVVRTGNPQVASYFVTVPSGGQVMVGFGEQGYDFNTSSIKAPDAGGQVRVLVAGMKANTSYHMRAIVSLKDGSVVADIDHVFQTGSLPVDELPTLKVTRSGLGEESPGVQLFDDFDFTNRVNLFATDRDGDIIWTYPRSAAEGGYQPAKLLDDGNIIVNTTSEIREFNLAGETMQDFGLDTVNAAVSAAGYQVPINMLHHDLQKLPNGHYILLGNTYKSVILNGQDSPTPILGDVVIDLDPNLNVVWFWNSFDHLDVNRRSPDPDGFTATNDWTHSNAVLYLPQDGNLLVSMRHQSWILKIDYEDGTGSGEVLWRLGWQGDFTLPGDPGAWFFYQHYPSVLSDDGTHMRIAVFDNGDDRVLDTQQDICGTAGQPACYSRALILDVDEQAKAATAEFQASLGLFSNWGGSAQVGPAGNFLAGITVTNTGGRAAEIGTQNPSQLIWQLDVLGQNTYRSLRIPSLYPGVEWH